MAARLATLLEVLLVIILRRIERGRRRDLRPDRLAPVFLGPVERCGSGRLLGGVREEDRRPVLGAQIPTLTVQGRWIVVGPEKIQQLLIAHCGWIKLDLDGFGVPGPSAANLSVRGAFRCPSGIADRGRRHARDFAKRGFDAPETAG